MPLHPADRALGVAVDHTTLDEAVRLAVEVYDVGPGDRVYQGNGLTTGFGVEAVWLAWAAGAAVVAGAPDLRGPRLRRFLANSASACCAARPRCWPPSTTTSPNSACCSSRAIPARKIWRRAGPGPAGASSPPAARPSRSAPSTGPSCGRPRRAQAGRHPPRPPSSSTPPAVDPAAASRSRPSSPPAPPSSLRPRPVAPPDAVPAGRPPRCGARPRPAAAPAPDRRCLAAFSGSVLRTCGVDGPRAADGATAEPSSEPPLRRPRLRPGWPPSRSSRLRFPTAAPSVRLLLRRLPLPAPRGRRRSPSRSSPRAPSRRPPLRRRRSLSGSPRCWPRCCRCRRRRPKGTSSPIWAPTRW